MRIRLLPTIVTVVTALLLVGTAQALAAAPAMATTPQAAAAAAVGAIANPAFPTCLDPSLSGNGYDTLAGATCNGSLEQSFTFRLISGPPHTYKIIDRFTGKCVEAFRFGIQENDCAYDHSGWTIRRVSSSVTTHLIQAPTTVGTPYASCWKVIAQQPGMVGPLFTVNGGCAAIPARVFRLTAGL